jgi:hypothetical protein
MQHWQQFFRRAQVRQILVCFERDVRSAFQVKTVKGRVQILHSAYRYEVSSCLQVKIERFFQTSGVQLRQAMARSGKVYLHHGRFLASVHMDYLEGSFRRLKGSRWSPTLIC